VARGNRLRDGSYVVLRRDQRDQAVAIRTDNKMIEQLIAMTAGKSSFNQRGQQPGVRMAVAGCCPAQTMPNNLG
jgi:hypothetical protein